MEHWLKILLPNNASAAGIAQKIEDADERVRNLKEQINAVQARRSELEDEGRSLAAQCVDNDQLESVANDEVALLDSCKLSAAILQGDLRRLFVGSTPFLSELAQAEMTKANSIHDNVLRWISRF